ncbi:toll/interleukin-1 receptor domain-containing protein [Chryseobacterium sp. DT-3]|uniref:toll/interleukin-1 receptor domain-containing protein n=1 Tax=Chryseobacterium sp. DT-3 TaxID=3396164 RepID=UPI003F1D0D55
MNEEKIIQQEAQEFLENSNLLNPNINSSDKLSSLKSKLYDFYSSEHKAIFLDELEVSLKKYLQDHRDRSHGGQPKEDCAIEESAEKLLFYIKQELNTLPKIVHQKNEISENPKREKVFVSYSHSGSSFLIDIKRHFKPFLEKIDFWDDNNIKPGQKWKEEIKQAMSKAKVAILLVSTDFLGSDFIRNEELPELLSAAENEGAVILTVILKPCLFEEFSEINIYQAMNSPSSPVSKMDENTKEELYVNLVRQTLKILSE